MEAYSYNKLRGRIVEKFGSQAAFSKAVPMSEVSISKKLTGDTRFSQSDIIRWCELLEIEKDDIGAYFFA